MTTEMMLSMSDICEFTASTPSSGNFIEGEKFLHAGHILFCGKMHNDLYNKNNINLIAFCLQSSHLKETPHEIKGEISFEGIINNMKCSCKAGLSGKCKHVVADLLRICIRLIYKEFSTDMICLWSTPQANALEDYNAAPLRDHNCFVNAFDKEYKTNITEEDETFIQNLLFNCNMDSALSKHMLGRHEIIIADVENNNLVIDSVKLQALLENLPSESMKNLKEGVLEEEMKTCCKSFFKQLSRDTRSICVETQSNRRKWLESRQFRITGSRCYSIFIYCNNKRPQWERKSLQYFYSKPFKATPQMKYGVDNEPHARAAYITEKKVEVIEFGLIVPDENPWLGYSPDGVVFEDGHPVKLIEIKCPFSGKNKTAEGILDELQYIKLPEKTLKEKHAYYGQVQLDMATLNIQKTDSIIYASFDRTIVVIPVEFNVKFVDKMLQSLKRAYFSNMIHYICIQEGLAK